MLRGGEGGGQGAHQVQHYAAGGDGGGKGFLHAFEAKDMTKNTILILLFSTNLQNIESSIEDQIQQLERLQREISESGGDESTISPLQVHLKVLYSPFCCDFT